MYEKIYEAYRRLSKGDQAELKRASLKNIGDIPAYFKVIKMTGCKDTEQTQRVIFLLVHTDVAEEEGVGVGVALLEAGVNLRNVQQIVRSGDNSIDYLKRQIVRCKNININSIGRIAQYWGDHARRELLKEFILNQKD
ncbi:hypothetical protein [Saccharophagus degradans]|uniref:CRISPR type III-B/RAMP module-associated protein Cmr5 n=1 Tax=Saccharophagus degradans TaxID=86304 RepID=A0AAW7X7D7_9GAMM|nr:hypothetical protein [Saccharophagus degradans]MDO6422767.1 hypothetical protein [Saccharophagus degradans]MDO6606240.1 hypothetical protein [Saccharophagus degradans]